MADYTQYRVIELLKEIKELVSKDKIQSEWFDINQAAQYCSVSKATLRRNIQKGALKVSKRVGKLLFKRSELDKWLQG
tara:strand:- start:1524 stop:1757 length:234 start_codon:yes stop_codon:yes gene_type:complete